MTEEQKKAVAVFRYGVIADFVGATRLDRGERESLLRDECGRVTEIIWEVQEAFLFSPSLFLKLLHVSLRHAHIIFYANGFDLSCQQCRYRPVECLP